ncbi:MAG: ubiquinol-cytochrome c reductase iron-sulfur subunit [Dehalococcoidia bacterium]
MAEETGPIKKEEEGEGAALYASAATGDARGLKSRRQFLGLGLGVLAMSVAGESTWVVLKGLEAGAKAPPQPVEVQVGDIPEGGTKDFAYGGDAALVMKSKDGVQVLSLVCTHLGCIVIWHPEDESFSCPCHAASFDKSGRVTGGPPPAALERLPFKQTGDKIIVGG